VRRTLGRARGRRPPGGCALDRGRPAAGRTGDLVVAARLSMVGAGPVRRGRCGRPRLVARRLPSPAIGFASAGTRPRRCSRHLEQLDVDRSTVALAGSGRPGSRGTCCASGAGGHRVAPCRPSVTESAHEQRRTESWIRSVAPSHGPGVAAAPPGPCASGSSGCGKASRSRSSGPSAHAGLEKDEPASPRCGAGVPAVGP
jgi:hypothetical protein